MKRPIDRRDLLRFGSAAFVLGAASRAFALPRRASWSPSAPLMPNKKLLVIFQRGGCDGVNVIVPRHDLTEYLALRPTIHLDLTPGTGDVIQITSSALMHRGLEKVLPVYNAGDLAFIHQVGYDQHSRSHFESMRRMETTVHDNPAFLQGYVPRMASKLDPTGANPLFGVSITNQLQTAFAGLPSMPVMPDVASYKLSPHVNPSDNYAKLEAAIEDAHTHPANPAHAHDALVRETGSKLLDSLDTVATLPPFVPDPWTTHPYPANQAQAALEGLDGNGVEIAFLQRLKNAMHLLTEPTAMVQVAGVEIGAWDTHSDQLYEQDYLLRALGHGLRSVYEDADAKGIWSDLVVWVVTEFGRTSGENANGGTDHGNGSLSMMMGGPVNGGVYNCDPATWVSGPSGTLHGVVIPGGGPHLLPSITDYRVPLREALANHMGMTATDINDVIVDYDVHAMNDPLRFAPLGVI